MDDICSLILAAGYGKRLRPLTLETPKPLLSLGGVPLLYLWLYRLQKFGFKNIAINTYYLADLIENALNHYPNKKDINLKISKEKVLLGTGGAIKPLKEWIGKKDLLIVNSDIVSTSDIKELIKTHKAKEAFATMGVLAKPLPGETTLWVEDGFVIKIGGQTPPSSQATAHGFACQHILNTRFFNYFPKDAVHSIIRSYQKVLDHKKPVAAHLISGFWLDIGTAKNYWLAQQELLNCTHKKTSLFEELAIQELAKKMGFFPQIYQKEKEHILAPAYLSHPPCFSEKSLIGINTVICGPVYLPAHSKIENSVLLEKASLKPYEKISQMIVGQNFRIEIGP